MQITVIGTGRMAAAFLRRFAAGNHSVQFVGRDARKAADLANQLNRLRSGSGSSTELGDDLTGEVVVLAIRYLVVLETLPLYREQLAEKIVIDPTNPVNPEYQDLLVEPGTSSAEEIAAAIPKSARLVKAFNTTFHGTLGDGEAGGRPLDVFIAGDDEEAKVVVSGLVAGGGMRAVDVGELRRARALEGFQLIHIMAQQTLGTTFRTQVKLLA